MVRRDGGRSGSSGRSGRAKWSVRPAASAASAAVVALVIASAAPLPAQAVRGQLVDQGNGFPIGGAFVVLLDEGGAEVGRVLTGPDGTFLLRAPVAGSYRLQSKRIGFRVSHSPPLRLAEGQTVGFRLQVEAVPARLPPVVVEGRPQCGTRGEQGTAVARLWEEVREALAAVKWTSGQRLHYTADVFEREYAVAGGRVLEERRSTRTGYGETPFKSLPGEELLGRGYVVTGPRDTVDYYAPDAEVLLGDAFVNTHCFTAKDGGNEHPGLVGLVFEPLPSRALPDVEGVLWIEKASLELRFLDFTYAKLPWQMPEGALGGHVEFLRVPTGAWIVKHWWIRMAKMARVVYRDTGRQADPRVMGYREVGGEVVTIDSTHVIAWTATDDDSVATVDLYYSTDSGLSFPDTIAVGRFLSRAMSVAMTSSASHSSELAIGMPIARSTSSLRSLSIAHLPSGLGSACDLRSGVAGASLPRRPSGVPGTLLDGVPDPPGKCTAGCRGMGKSRQY